MQGPRSRLTNRQRRLAREVWEEGNQVLSRIDRRSLCTVWRGDENGDGNGVYFAIFGNYIFHCIRTQILDMGDAQLMFLQFVQRIGQLWTASQRLRSELGLLAFRHPITERLGAGSVVVSAMMMVPSTRSKVLLHFHLEPDLLFDWPAGLGSVQVSSSVVYGAAE